jgi:hypothetical protein
MDDGPTRFFGLDIHKEYFVAVAVNQEREAVFGPNGFRIINWMIGQGVCSHPKMRLCLR